MYVLRNNDVFILLAYRSITSTVVQCIAGGRQRRGTGQVAFILNNADVGSEEDFTYTDDPQVFSLVKNEIIERYILCSVNFSATYVYYTVEVLI